ncbi:ATP-binding cassette domain-containing protein [Kosmotoga sp.]|uniref:energy-coupling factor ABC transporter ATP-binding protein n=1 Tax=Kosmotoga sp. TaxID=1955248 RepID=UPI0024AC4E5E|nr:ATP-binding cassette domain-containing protein [Kosmotoga sp.]MDI3524397.1 energy-coupling factor transport system ATP-binding protein [Kosmotoga sp.]MDK2952706.1 energy-coupling factor transport system ATP-binding protein [Kosmotoga sp.]
MCPSSSEILLELEDISYEINGKKVLNGIDLRIFKGEFFGILGSNGSGKTTLLRLVLDLIKSTKGEVRKANTVDIIGYIFQNPDNQIVGSSVEEDIIFGLENLGLTVEEIKTRVDETLKTMGLEDLRDVDTISLSGGQKQLLCIASIVAMRPEVILMDEPYSMLGRGERRKVKPVVEGLINKGTAIVMASTRLEELCNCHRVALLESGRLVFLGPPEELRKKTELLERTGIYIPLVC